MNKTVVINFFAGPGCGKSTTAADLFAYMKHSNLNVELVREWVKDWAYEGRPITKGEQIYVFGKQFKKESLLYGKVDYIITDSPLLLSSYYTEKYNPDLGEFSSVVKSLIKSFEKDGVSRVNFLLERNKPYSKIGRYETEEQAKQIDKEMERFLIRNDVTFAAVPYGCDKSLIMDLIGAQNI